MALHVILSTHPTGAGVPHKVQVQAATVAGLGESRVVKEVLFSQEQGTVVCARIHPPQYSYRGTRVTIQYHYTVCILEYYTAVCLLNIVHAQCVATESYIQCLLFSFCSTNCIGLGHHSYTGE